MPAPVVPAAVIRSFRCGLAGSRRSSSPGQTVSAARPRTLSELTVIQCPAAAWHAAALGMLGRLETVLGSSPQPADVSQAFVACLRCRRSAGLLSICYRAAPISTGSRTTRTAKPLDAASGLSTGQENVVSWLRELGARTASSD